MKNILQLLLVGLAVLVLIGLPVGLLIVSVWQLHDALQKAQQQVIREQIEAMDQHD